MKERGGPAGKQRVCRPLVPLTEAGPISRKGGRRRKNGSAWGAFERRAGFCLGEQGGGEGKKGWWSPFTERRPRSRQGIRGAAHSFGTTASAQNIGGYAVHHGVDHLSHGPGCLAGGALHGLAAAFHGPGVHGIGCRARRQRHCRNPRRRRNGSRRRNPCCDASSKLLSRPVLLGTLPAAVWACSVQAAPCCFPSSVRRG